MLGGEKYRHRRDSARRDRDDDIDDPSRMMAGGNIDIPDKRARTSRVHNDFDAARCELNIQLRDASSVGAAATAVLEQGPIEFVCVRVKEDPNELIPRYDLVSESLSTYLDLTESVLRSSSTGNW